MQGGSRKDLAAFSMEQFSGRCHGRDSEHFVTSGGKHRPSERGKCIFLRFKGRAGLSKEGHGTS